MNYRFLRFPQGKYKAVTFSYDDGVESDLKLVELFERYHIKATFNLNSQFTRRARVGNHLTIEEAAQYFLKKGHEIAIHGAFHLAPGKLRPIDGIREFLECRLELEEMFDTIIRGMAYPNSGIRILENGLSYNTVRDYLQNLDIAYARTLGGDNDSFQLPNDWFAWMPTAHHDNERIFDFIDSFVRIANDNSMYRNNRHPRLFYVWGHSFEFDRNHNWDRMEEICARLGERDDSWYATNLEIYDYMTAYHSLIFSGDGTRVYNPTNQKLWFEIIGDKLYSVEPGETIRCTASC